MFKTKKENAKEAMLKAYEEYMKHQITTSNRIHS